MRSGVIPAVPAAPSTLKELGVNASDTITLKTPATNTADVLIGNDGNGVPTMPISPGETFNVYGAATDSAYLSSPTAGQVVNWLSH